MSLKYVATQIGNGDNVALVGLSETNLVVGKTFRKVSAGQLQSASERAIVWVEGVLTQIDVGPCFNSQAMSVGDGNVIVGTGTNPNKWGVFSWVEENGIVSRLDGLGGSNIMVEDTNGRVHCGQASLPNRIARAVKWENNQCVDLGTLGGPGALARGVNRKGSVVGSSRVSASVNTMGAFIHKDGKMTALPKNDTLHSHAFGVNDQDDVVGAVAGGWKPAKWEKAEKLVVLSESQGQAFDINNDGIVVGTVGNPGVAFVHDGKTLHFLNDITDGLNGVSLAVARRINNQGCIAAYGFDNKFNMIGFLLIPA